MQYVAGDQVSKCIIVQLQLQCGVAQHTGNVAEVYMKYPVSKARTS